MKKNGFTLVELMVVIAIIAILAVGSITGYNSYIEKANASEQLQELVRDIRDLKIFRIDSDGGGSNINKELEIIAKVIDVARVFENKTSTEITGDGCSDCACRGHNFIEPLTTEAQSCVNTWNQFIDIVRDNISGLDISFLRTDPWGSPYLIDENEGDGVGGGCRNDRIYSAGPNRIHDSVDSITGNPSVDDVSYIVPHYSKGNCI